MNKRLALIALPVLLALMALTFIYQGLAGAAGSTRPLDPPAGRLETGIMPRTFKLHVGPDNYVLLNHFSSSGSLGVFRLDNNRPVWHRQATFASADQLTLSPAFDQDGTIIASKLNFGPYLQVTHDWGESWMVPAQSVTQPVRLLVASPTFASDETAFAVSSYEPSFIWRSADAGDHWQVIATVSDAIVWELLVSPYFNSDQIVYALANPGNVLRSENGGVSWAPANNGLTSTFSTSDLDAVSLGNGESALFAATYTGVMLSDDEAQNWEPLSPIRFSKLHAAADAQSNITLFGLTSDGVLSRSINLGSSWTTLLPGEEIEAVRVAPDYSENETVYAITETRLWRSTNGGASWSEAASRPSIATAFNNSLDLTLSPSFDQDGIVFAVPAGSGDNWIIRSTNGGFFWEKLTLPSSDNFALALSPQEVDESFLLVADDSILYRSNDNGNTWDVFTDSLPFTIRHIYFSPGYANDQTLFISTSGEIYRSSDGGYEWENITPEDGFALDLRLSPDFPDDPTIFAWSYTGSTLYRSDNGGEDWDTIETGMLLHDLELSSNFASDGVLFAAEGLFPSGLVHRSDNRGDSWTPLPDPPDSDPVVDIAISPQFEVDQTILVASEEGTVSLSEDGGQTWHTLDVLPRIGGTGGRPTVLLSYEDGLLTPFASSADSVYRYGWPLASAAAIWATFDVSDTAPIILPLALTIDSDAPIPWSAGETAGWLSIDPTAGTWPAVPQLTIQPPVSSGIVNTTLTLTLDYSMRQQGTLVIPVTAARGIFHELYLPILSRN